MENQRSEQILSAWLKMTTIINNDKITGTLPFNEAMICRYLYENRDKNVIASKLCQWMHMKKSQMNRTLTNMENKNLIHRIRNTEDKRQIFIVLNDEMNEVYQKQHQKVLQIVDDICKELGEEKTEEVLSLFSLISNIAENKINS